MNILFQWICDTILVFRNIYWISLQRCWKNPANIANALTTLYNMSCYSTYKYNIDKSLSKHTAIC